MDTIKINKGAVKMAMTGIDSIVCAGQLITALQTIVSRSVSPLLPAVLLPRKHFPAP